MRILLAACAVAFGLGLTAAPALAAPPPLEAYGQLPAVEEVQLSPSGARHAIIAVVEDKRRLVVFEGDRLLATADVGDLKVRGLDWAGESRIIVRHSKTYNLGMDYGGRYEIGHAVVVNIDTRAVLPIFAKGRSANGVWGYYGTAQQNGRWYGWFGGQTLEQAGKSLTGARQLEDGHPDLYRVDLDTGQAELVDRATGGDQSTSWLVSSDGVLLATTEYNERARRWRLFKGEGRGAPVTTAELSWGGGLVGQGRAPGTVVYTGQDKISTSYRWFEIPLDGGQAAQIPAENWLSPLFDRKTGLMIGMTVDGDRIETRLFAPLQQARMKGTAKAFPGMSVSLVSWNETFDKLVVLVEGDGESGAYWMVDIKTGKAVDLGFTYPRVKSADVGATRMVAYKAADGLAMSGVLTLPPGVKEPKGLPLVVMPHGGPIARDRLGFDWWAQAFASRGYAVFQPNFRGSDGISDAFFQAGTGEWGRKMQTDISDGVAELARQGIVDAKRACIVGASYGGYAALAGVTLQQGLYRCAVSYAGVSDMRAMRQYNIDREIRGGSTYRYWNEFVGPIGQLDEISPARLAARADAPVLLIHGREDVIVPLAQSETMRGALKRADKPVEFVLLQGEDHWMSTGVTRLQLLEASVAFVQKHNPAQ